MLPLVEALGTMALNSVSDIAVKSAGTPSKVTAVVPSRSFPRINTLPPTRLPSDIGIGAKFLGEARFVGAAKSEVLDHTAFSQFFLKQRSIFSGLTRLYVERVALRCALGSLGYQLSTSIHEPKPKKLKRSD
jgi:hypothetical protein